MKLLILFAILLLNAADAGAQQQPSLHKPRGRRTVMVAAPSPIIRYVEQYAAFNGDMQEYSGAKLHYPIDAVMNGVEGRTEVLFEIMASGKVRVIDVQRSSGSRLLDDAALSFVSNMPDWKPAKIQGVPQRVLMVLPVFFHLD